MKTAIAASPGTWHQRRLQSESRADKALRLIVDADDDGLSNEDIKMLLGCPTETVYTITCKLRSKDMIKKVGSGREALWMATELGQRQCAEIEPAEPSLPALPPISPVASQADPAPPTPVIPTKHGVRLMSLLGFIITCGEKGATAEAIRAGVPGIASWTGLKAFLHEMAKLLYITNIVPRGGCRKAIYVATQAGIEKYQARDSTSEPDSAKDGAAKRLALAELCRIAEEGPKRAVNLDETPPQPNGQAAPPVAIVLSLVVNLNVGKGITDRQIFAALQPLKLDDSSLDTAIALCLNNQWITSDGTSEITCRKSTLLGAAKHRRQLARVIMHLIDRTKTGIADSSIYEKIECWGVTLGNIAKLTNQWERQGYIEGRQREWKATELGVNTVLRQEISPQGRPPGSKRIPTTV